MIGVESTSAEKKISRRSNFSIRERDFFYSRKNFWHRGGKKNLARAELFYSRKRFFLFAKELLTPGWKKKSGEG